MQKEKVAIRESNFELLRIVAMLLICILHTSNWCLTDTKAALLSSFSVIGVNLFVMITGWWGVRSPLKSIIKIWIEVACLKVVCCIVFSVLHATPITIADIVRSLWMGGYWFVTAYVGLLLFSPILERALEAKQGESDREWLKRFTVIIALLTIMNCFFGWLLKGAQINATGQTFVQMIYLYVFARYLRRLVEYGSFQRCALKGFCWGGYFICSALMFIGYLIVVVKFHLRGQSMDWLAYNNPIIIVSATSVFLLFAKMKIKNGMINKIATTTFGVYILHTSCLQSDIVSLLKTIVSDNVLVLLVSALVLFVVCAFVSWGIGLMRKYLIDHTFLQTLIEKHAGKIDGKLR